jgi:SAM-dependent methyltransferase
VNDAGAAHWDAVYGSRAEDAVSWFQESPATSLELLASLSLPVPASLVDVGGGASRLVDALLAHGGYDVTVVDVAAQGLAHARTRLGVREPEVAWQVADVTRWQPPGAFDVWHDRAVFHFLVAADDRDRYRQVLHSAVRPGGHVVVATFAVEGPEQCSGLPVVRYGPDRLHEALAPGWERVTCRAQLHRTPWGGVQPFTWLVLRRPPAVA